MPDHIDTVVGFFLINITRQHRNQSDWKDPTHGIHKFNWLKACMKSDTLSRQRITRGELRKHLGRLPLENRTFQG
jgi:hypothetical protein